MEESCLASCGEGYKILRREIIREATNNGSNCEGDHMKIEKCIMAPCSQNDPPLHTAVVLLSCILGTCQFSIIRRLDLSFNYTYAERVE